MISMMSQTCFSFFTETCTTVVCSFTMTNVVDSATYNGNKLTIIGDNYLGDSTKLKSVTFESCYDKSPGTLYIKGSHSTAADLIHKKIGTLQFYIPGFQNDPSYPKQKEFLKSTQKNLK